MGGQGARPILRPRDGDAAAAGGQVVWGVWGGGEPNDGVGTWGGN